MSTDDEISDTAESNPAGDRAANRPERRADRPASISDRYAVLELRREVVIYDRENAEAWIQSDRALDVSLTN